MSDGINWNLAGNAGNNALTNFQFGAQIGEQARQRRDEREYRQALETLSANPDDEAARAVVYRNDPRTAIAIGQDADRRAFNKDIGDYVGGQTNALLGVGNQSPPPQMPRNALINALEPAPPGATFGEAFATLGQPAQAQQVPAEPQAEGPDLSFLGEPQSAKDAAFMRMMRRDPVQALKIQTEMRDTFVNRLKAESDFYTLAVGELSRMRDDVGWQAALQRLAPMAQALGNDLTQSVPATYPGPEAVQQLLEGALPVKERLDQLLQEANIDADNARQDRNVDSLIGDRDARRAETRRNNEARIATTQRGQDITDRRVRSGAGSGGRTGGRASTRPSATDASGNKVEWDGKAWVPVA